MNTPRKIVASALVAAALVGGLATPANAWSWPDQRTVGCWIMFGRC